MERFGLIMMFMLVPLITSCNSNSEAPQLTVEEEVIEQPDTEELVLIVARHMFEQTAPKDGGVAPAGFHCFIVGKPYDTREFLAAFADFRIPVLGSKRLGVKNDCPCDEHNGDHAMLWENFDVKNVGANEATIYVEWRLGPEGAAGYTVQLVRLDGKWIVKSVNEEWMS